MKSKNVSKDILENEVKTRIKKGLLNGLPTILGDIRTKETDDVQRDKDSVYGRSCLEKIFERLDSISQFSSIAGASTFLYFEKPETDSQNQLRFKLLELYNELYLDKANEYYFHNNTQLNSNLVFIKHVEEKAIYLFSSIPARLHFYSFVLREIESKMQYDFDNETCSRRSLRYPKSRRKVYLELRENHDLPILHGLIKEKISNQRIRLISNKTSRVEAELLRDSVERGKLPNKSYKSIINDLKREITSVFHELHEKGLVIDDLENFLKSEFVIDDSDVSNPPLKFNVELKGKPGIIIRKLSSLVHRKMISNNEKELSYWIFYRLFPECPIHLSAVEKFVSNGKSSKK
ncbi:MAG: hypothetical protein JNJ75_08460 [Cyclobacteriaceae bacterium]|nr:hypothetical protein [Cyclobacteriaceae bacterium]